MMKFRFFRLSFWVAPPPTLYTTIAPISSNIIRKRIQNFSSNMLDDFGPTCWTRFHWSSLIQILWNLLLFPKINQELIFWTFFLKIWFAVSALFHDQVLQMKVCFSFHFVLFSVMHYIVYVSCYIYNFT